MTAGRQAYVWFALVAGVAWAAPAWAEGTRFDADGSLLRDARSEEPEPEPEPDVAPHTQAVWSFLAVEYSGPTTHEARFNGERLGSETQAQRLRGGFGARLRLDWPLVDSFSVAGDARFNRSRTNWEVAAGVPTRTRLGLAVAPTARLLIPRRSAHPPPHLYISMPVGLEWISAADAEAVEPARIHARSALGRFYGLSLGGVWLNENQLAVGAELGTAFHSTRQTWVARSQDGTLRTNDTVRQRVTIVRLALLIGGWW